MVLMPAPHRWARRFLPGVRHYLLALTFFVVTFALVPFSIYAHSGEDWGIPFSWLLRLAALGLALFVATAVLIRLAAIVHVRAASTVAITMFCLGVFLLLAHVYAPIEIGPLDGTAIRSAESSLSSIVELGLLAGVVLLFVLLQRGRVLRAAAMFAGALLLIATGYGGFLAWAEEPTGRTPPAPAASASAIDGNVYHIVLDRMQTGALLRVLEKLGAADAFRGFELFRNNVANYLRTPQSAASYFTGTYFDGEDYKRWIREWRGDTGLLPTLSRSGYRLWMYSPITYWESRHVDVLQYNLDLYEQETGFAGSGLYDLLQIWLASLVPNQLTNEALPLAESLADRTFRLLTGRPRPLSGHEGLHVQASVLMLRRLAREEAVRSPNGEYVYAHALLPHGPLVLDRDCTYVGGKRKRARPVKTTQQAYLLQAECGLGLVVAFLQELGRLGRYDAATIAIHGDTGTWVPLGENRQRRGRILGRPISSLLSYLQTPLMIKRPQAQGPLQVVDTPTQLVDLYPTLLDLLDLSPPATPLDGRSVYSAAADEPRPTYVIFDPDAKHGLGRNLIEVQIDDPLDLPRSELTVIGPVARSPAELPER
jgi:hypothetical protein